MKIPSNVLWVIGHPTFEKAVGAQRVAEIVGELGGQQVRVIQSADWNRSKEQDLWASADAVVLHFPLYWYGMPGLLKSYIDDLLQPGWAFGKGGNALHAKPLVASITTGAPIESYGPAGKNEHDLETYMIPMARMTAFTNMEWRGVVATGSVPWQVPEERWDAHVAEIFERLV